MTSAHVAKTIAEALYKTTKPYRVKAHTKTGFLKGTITAFSTPKEADQRLTSLVLKFQDEVRGKWVAFGDWPAENFKHESQVEDAVHVCDGIKVKVIKTEINGEAYHVCVAVEINQTSLPVG